MAIQISPNGRLMTIQTNDSSYQMLADKNGVLLHLYYGSSIGAEDLSDLIVRSDVGFSGNPEEAPWLSLHRPGAPRRPENRGRSGGEGSAKGHL